jgi:myosin tail region-interacting protein MTI1
MPAVPFKVRAVFEYASEEPDDLKFPNGQIITVTDDQDEDWYTGEYTSAAGDKLEGMFPRNFVERYEPSIPSRPARTPKKAPAPETLPEPAALLSEPAAPQPPEPVKDAEIQDPHDSAQPAPPAGEPDVPTSLPPAPQLATAAIASAKSVSPPSTTSSKPGPPPVAEKPASSSFRDRIAAFNKPAAAPIAPFNPGGQGASLGFIKKPFVAPPPSKNSYVPPPREPPPQKIYRREEDATIQHEEEREGPESSRPADEDADDQPKPTSLKERIALLQKQQLEQAQRHAESSQKKEKPKKPLKKRVEPVEEAEPAAREDHLERLDTNETVGKKVMEAPEDDTESLKSPRVRQASINIPTPLPPRELVSDTNDADDSGAGDTEDAPGTSTEEDRPRSKGNAAVGGVEPVPPKKAAPESDKEAGEEGDEEETEEEEEDPEVRRKRELRDRMARLGGGVGMMGMFGPPGGMPGAGPPRKSRQSTEGSRQSSEQHDQEEMARAPPVPIMALPGMSNQVPKRTEEPVEAESDEDETAHATPQDLPREAGTTDDYIAQPPKRSSTGYSAASGPHGMYPFPRWNQQH